MVRSYTARRPPQMFDDVPNWLAAAWGAALSGTGVLLAGFIRARVDNKRTRVDDRADFTKSILERLSQVEQSAQEERKFCEERMNTQARVFEDRIAQRDRIITELRKRVDHLERKLDGADRIQQ